LLESQVAAPSQKPLGDDFSRDRRVLWHASATRLLAQRPPVGHCDNHCAFAWIEFDAALEGVTGVDEQHGSTLSFPDGAEVAQVSAQQGETTVVIPWKDVPV
jgi:hypothetical protein